MSYHNYNLSCVTQIYTMPDHKDNFSCLRLFNNYNATAYLSMYKYYIHSWLYYQSIFQETMENNLVSGNQKSICFHFLLTDLPTMRHIDRTSIKIRFLCSHTTLLPQVTNFSDSSLEPLGFLFPKTFSLFGHHIELERA